MRNRNSDDAARPSRCHFPSLFVFCQYTYTTDNLFGFTMSHLHDAESLQACAAADVPPAPLWGGGAALQNIALMCSEVE